MWGWLDCSNRWVVIFLDSWWKQSGSSKMAETDWKTGLNSRSASWLNWKKFSSFSLKGLKKYSFRRNVGLEDVSKYFKISYFYNFISDYFQNIVNEGNIYWDFYKQENMSQTENNSYLDIVFADPDNSNMGLMIVSDINNDITTIYMLCRI